MRWKSTKHSAIIFLMLAALTLQGCATYRIQAGNGETYEHSEVMWSLFWGLKQARNPIERCELCTKEPLAVVTVKRNFAYDLLTVLTLGFASRIEMEWIHSQPDYDTFTPPEDTTRGE